MFLQSIFKDLSGMSKNKSKGSNYQGNGDRGLHVKVKTAKGRPMSSTRWLSRQLNDPYVRRAKQAGYRSRSTFKLIEIDDKHNLLKPGLRVVDLGAAPGGWSEISAHRVKSTNENPLVVGVDKLEMEELPGVIFIQKDFLDDDGPLVLMNALGGHNANVVLSDLAAPTTGHRKTDHLRTVHLFEVAAEFARESLEIGGDFLAKVFRGGTEGGLLMDLKRDFQTVQHLKPPSSRKESPELYVLAKGYKGTRISNHNGS